MKYRCCCCQNFGVPDGSNKRFLSKITNQIRSPHMRRSLKMWPFFHPQMSRQDSSLMIFKKDIAGFWQLPPIVVVVFLIEISRTRLCLKTQWDYFFQVLKSWKTHLRRRRSLLEDNFVSRVYFERTGSNVNGKNLAKYFRIIIKSFEK